MSLTNNTGITPDFGDVIRSIIDTVLLDVNVCLPAKIVTYDKDTQYADVQILLQQNYSDGTLVTLPVIPNVPVKHPRANGGKAFIHMPLKPGDDVTLHFSQRSLDAWKSQGGITNTQDIRKHHIADAFASIGGSAMPDAFTPSTDDSIEIVNENSKVIVHPDGTYNLYGGNDDDLVQVLSDLIFGIKRAYTVTLLGNQPLLDPLDPAWVIISQRIAAFVNGSDPYEEI